MARPKLKEPDVEVAPAPICANCAAELVGPYCHACGQKAHLHHKLSHLAEEFVEGVAHFDGRLWRTLPVLAFNPGRLSREWRQGRRMTYVAPLHIFLFAVFLLFLIPTFTGQHLLNFGPGGIAVHDSGSGEPMPAWVQGIETAMSGALKQPEYYGYKIETLAYKLSFMVAPISMGILWLLMLWPRRGFTLYDHAVVSLYGLGFLALLVSLALVGPAWVLAAVPPIALAHAVRHLKGAYGLSWLGAAARGVVLAALSMVGFVVFVLGVTLLGVAA